MSEQVLEPTPAQTIGPFFAFGLEYPGMNQVVHPHSPGAITLSGTIYDGAGAPIPDALIEIFGADSDGTVPRSRGSLRRDGLGSGDLGRRLLATGRRGFAPLAAALFECAGEPSQADVVAYLRALSPDRPEACLLRIIGDPRQIPPGYVTGLLQALAREPSRRDPVLGRIVGEELCRFVLARAGEPEAAERRAYAIRYLAEFPAAGARELLEGLLDDRRWLVLAREPRCVRAAAKEALRRL